jgi:hypothetical protein
MDLKIAARFTAPIFSDSPHPVPVLQNPSTHNGTTFVKIRAGG